MILSLNKMTKGDYSVTVTVVLFLLDRTGGGIELVKLDIHSVIAPTLPVANLESSLCHTQNVKDE